MTTHHTEDHPQVQHPQPLRDGPARSRRDGAAATPTREQITVALLPGDSGADYAQTRVDGLTVNVYWFTDVDGSTRLVVDVLTGEDAHLTVPVRVYVNDENNLAYEQVDPDPDPDPAETERVDG